MTPLFQQIAETIGVLDESTQKEAQLLAWANRAGKLLYDGFDLPGTVMEQFFCIDMQQHIISFPWYVGSLRGVRLHESSRQIKVLDMRPRYNTSPWNQPMFKWRELRPTPLSTSLTQSGTLTLSIPAPETFPFNVTIIGQTPLASRLIETLTFQVGDLEKTTVNQWTQEEPFGIVAIKKDRLTSNDISVAETATNSVVATIPNTQYEAMNMRVQILDFNLTQSWNSDDHCVEILYKKRYTPLVSLDDSWIDERLEQALVYAVKYLWAVEKQDSDAQMTYQGLYAQVCRDAVTNMEASQEIIIGMDENPLKNAPIRAPFYPFFYTYDRY
jgi:hypothetical protein